MAFDDVKTHEGVPYSGMRVGGRHEWHYPDGRWVETKRAPDAWDFAFTSRKVRSRAAPPGSGAPPGTGYHWFLLAHQWVRKVDADAYHTFMEGLKFKVAHRRPHWRRWSSEYPDQADERSRVIALLEATLARVRAEDGPRARLVATSAQPSSAPILGFKRADSPAASPPD